jgi:hypothetical protein
MENFGLTESDATKYYENWLETKKVEVVPVGNGLYFRPVNASNTIIKLKKSALGYKVSIEGITKLIYHKRIIGLVKFLTYFSAKDKMRSLDFIKIITKDDKNRYDDEIFRENVINDEKYLTMNDVSQDENSSYMLDNIENPFDAIDSMSENDGSMPSLENDTNVNKDVDEEEIPDNEVIINEEDALEQLRENPNTFQYVLNRLKMADKKLFVGTKEKKIHYSTKCQSSNKRQPIVISPEEKAKIDELYPNSYDKNFVAYGSDEKKMKQNIYICPEIWCPISRVSMTYQEFKKNKEQCPLGNNEPPIKLLDPYWQDKNAKRKPRYIGFTGDGKECLPCCFVKKPEIDKRGKKNQNKKQMDKCLGIENDEKEQTTKEDNKPKNKKLTGDTKGDKYIVGNHYPLDENRYGLLPQPLSIMFKNKKCGNGIEGTGLIVEGTNCFLRKGVYQTEQSFISCLASILNNKGDIINDIQEKLSVDIFLMLNDGGLCGLFINDKKSIFDKDEFTNFRRWFLNKKQNHYIQSFNLYDVRQDIEDNSAEGFVKENFINFKVIIREYMIYNSYTNFMSYIGDKSVSKTHDVLLDLFNRKIVWCNPDGYNIIIFNVEENNIYVSCPFNSSSTIDVSRKFVFIVKQDDIYEPIVRIKQENKSKIINSKMYFGYNEDENVTNIINFYMSNCKSQLKQDNKDASSIMSYLNMIGYKVRFQVINYNFKLEGFMLNNGIYIPCEHQPPVIRKNSRFIYIDDMVDMIKPVDYITLKTILKSLQDIIKNDFYTIGKVVVSTDKKNLSPLAIITKTGKTIPLTKSKFPHERYLDNLNIFISWEDDDERKIFVDEEHNKDLLYKILKNKLLKIYDNNDIIKAEIDFLRNVSNPFPLSFRTSKMDKLIKNLLEKIIIVSKDEEKLSINKTSCSAVKKDECVGLCKWHDGRCYIKVPQKWLDLFESKLSYTLLNLNIKKYEKVDIENEKIKSNEIYFDQYDVTAGKVSKIQNVLRDPYKYFDRILDDYVKDIIEDKIEVRKTITLKDVLSDEWKNLPTELNIIFNKKQGYDINVHKVGFGINGQETQESDFLPNLFNVINEIIGYDVTIKMDIFEKIVENRIIKEYNDYVSKNKIKDFLKELELKNPIFAYYIKRKTKPSLQDILEIFKMPDYRMSEYELVVLSNLLNIRIIVLARKSLRNPNKIKCIKPASNTTKFVLLWQTTKEDENKMSYDIYEPIVQDILNPKIVFTESDNITIRFNGSDNTLLKDYLDENCKTYYLFADMSENP